MNMSPRKLFKNEINQKWNQSKMKLIKIKLFKNEINQKLYQSKMKLINNKINQKWNYSKLELIKNNTSYNYKEVKERWKKL